MTPDALVWLDLEMTGLIPERDTILEAAVVITTGDLDVVACGPDLVIHHNEETLAGMDAWNQAHHGESGLIARVRASTMPLDAAEEFLLTFVAGHCAERKALLAGNSIHQDRAFLRRQMPRLEAFLHYRQIDVSTVKELVRRWYPDAFAQRPEKKKMHRALDDIHESIAELRYYRAAAFAQAGTASAPTGACR